MINLLKPPVELRRGFKDKKRLEMVAQYPCLVCQTFGLKQTTRVNVHHLAGIGAGMKASDLLTYPTCETHHQSGKVGEAVHKGIKEFEANFKSQIEFIGMVNEMIFRDNALKGKDLERYYLVKNWTEN